jgi:hypothetical protein
VCQNYTNGEEIMAVRLSTITSRSTVGIVFTLGMLAVLSMNSASTQVTSGSNQQISVLQQQLSALDRRVKSLEDAASAAAAADQVKQEPASGSSKPDATTLEARIAQLEGEVRSLQSQEAAGGEPQPIKSVGAGRPAGPQVLTVRAPFRVVDARGKTVMDVDVEKDNSPSLQVGNPTSGAVTVGALNGSGAVIVYRSGGKRAAGLGSYQGSLGVHVFAGDGEKQAVQVDESSIVFYSDEGNPLSLFGTKDREKGYMELNDSGGMKMVEAGMLNSKVGYVLATPYRSSVGVNGNPSVLMGGAGR